MNSADRGRVDQPMKSRWVFFVVMAGILGALAAPRLQGSAHADAGTERRQVDALESIARSLEKMADRCR